MTVGCSDCRAIPKVRGAGRCFVKDGVDLQRMHNGVHILRDCYCGPWMTEIICRLRGHHEPQEELVFYEILKQVRRGGTIVELGAWWSYYALWFLQEVPDGRAVLVEPDSGHLADGRRNFQLNSRTGEFIQASAGRARLAPRLFPCDTPQAVPLVPEISIDSLMSDQGIEHVQLLLVDVQGAELEVLHGARASIRAGQIRFVLISTHHHSISGDPRLHERCLAFVRDHGGHVIAQHNIIESFSGDGLIAATFDPADRLLPEIELSRNTEAGNTLFGSLSRAA